MCERNHPGGIGPLELVKLQPERKGAPWDWPQGPVPPGSSCASRKLFQLDSEPQFCPLARNSLRNCGQANLFSQLLSFEPEPVSILARPLREHRLLFVSGVQFTSEVCCSRAREHQAFLSSYP